MLKKFLAISLFTSSILIADVVSIPDKYLTENLNNTTVTNLSLESGWNLVSLCGYSQKSIDEVFNSDKIEQIYTYKDGNWFLYKPNDFDNIGDIEPSHGIWVKVKDNKQYNISFGVNVETISSDNCSTNPITGEVTCDDSSTTNNNSSTSSTNGNNCYENPITGEVTCNSSSTTTTSGYSSTSSGTNCGLPGLPACSDSSTSNSSSSSNCPTDPFGNQICTSTSSTSSSTSSSSGSSSSIAPPSSYSPFFR